MSEERLIIGITGASGAAYALNLLGHLERLRVPIDLVVSPSATIVLRREIDPSRAWVEDGLARLEDFRLDKSENRAFRHGDVAAAIASGTALRRGMVIVPCSMGSLGRIAAGTSSSLVGRAADVCLKERRRLVLVTRETPLSLIHLRNMQCVTEAGAIVLPASPGFYHGARGMEELLDHVSAKIMDVIGISHDAIRRWGEKA